MSVVGDFGALLREHRLRAGWTQEELAERSGVSPHAISVLETGRRRPRLSSVTWLATALGLDATGREQLTAAATASTAATAASRNSRTPARSGNAESAASESTSPHRGGFRCQLPSDTRLFTGRSAELDRLLALAEAAPTGSDAGMVVISAIDGTGGVGKSALAVHAAHRMRGNFPDGQLFIDLHGHTTGLAPATAEDALEWLLSSLGVAPQLIPQDLGARAAFYRDQLADTRTLIVLDNAVSVAQVRPLLPATPGCLVIVTSRRRLTGLDDAHTLALETLTPVEAAALLHKVAGPGRIPADHPAIGELLALCGHLPLAVRIAAARLRHRRALRVEDLVEQLRDERGRLDELSDEDRSLTAVFDTSYTALPEAEQHLFRRLGLVPGPDFDAYAAANLIEADQRTAERLLESLLDHNLLTQHTPGRYRFHDLVGVYARTRGTGSALGGSSQEQDRDREAALARLLGYYRHCAQDADHHLEQYSHPGPARTGPVPAAAPRLSDRARALAWMRAERGNLLAATTASPPGGGIALTASMAAFLLQEGPWQQAANLHHSAAAAARESGDHAAEAGALGDLGRVRHALAEFDASCELHERALAIYQELGHRHGEAGALEDVGRIRYMLGEFRTAHGLHERSLALYQELGDRLGEANALWGLGRARNAGGEYPSAADALERALRGFVSVGKRQGEANVLWDLSRVRHATGDYAVSGSLLERALAIMQDLGNRQGEANLLWSLGGVRATTGHYPAASDALERALAIYLDLGKRDGEAHCLKDLGRVRFATGDTVGAAGLLERALAAFRKHGLRYGELNTLHDLGRARHATGDYTAAADLFEQARSFNRENGDRQGEAEVLASMAALAADTTGPCEALARYREALPLYREARQLACQVNSPLDEAKALEGAARCTAHAGERDTALTDLRRAVALYRRLGAAETEAAAARLVALESDDSHS
ncbi:ATP-binding protein [Kitasatospora sp. McL0602]|uniref:ATP-binding protein n=1 Tax=Kitasatospora sp. McL0602 TaxID=3439530 RepID=UPI003F8BA26C